MSEKNELKDREEGGDALPLAAMLSRLEVFKKTTDKLSGAGMMQKANYAEDALNGAAVLFTDIVFIVHQYAGRAEQLERRILKLEGGK